MKRLFTAIALLVAATFASPPAFAQVVMCTQTLNGYQEPVKVTSSLPLPTLTVGIHTHFTGSASAPVKAGCQVQVSNDVSLVSGDVSYVYCTTDGHLVTYPYAPPELSWTYQAASPIATAGNVSMKAAAAAGIRNYVTGCDFANNSATATEIQIVDGASTVIWRSFLQPNTSATDFTFATPLRGTAATAMNFNLVTAGASVYVSCQGFTAP